MFVHLRFGATQCSCKVQELRNPEARLTRVDGANEDPLCPSMPHLTPVSETASRAITPSRVWFVVAIALGVRAGLLAELADTPLLEFVLGDAKNYVAWGREIAAGNWLGDETFYQAPLYPYFLGTLLSVFGDDLFAIRVFQLFLGAGSCGLLTLAGARFISPRAGLVTGLMLALYPPAFYADAMLQKSVLDIFFVCLGLWLVSVAATKPSGRAWAGLGLALGTMMLTRENALVFPLVLIPWVALRGEISARERGTYVAMFLLGISLVLVPVSTRNWVVGGEFHLTTSQFGHNLYIGNNPAADGTYAPLLQGRGDPRIERLDAIALAERALGKQLTPAEVSGFYTERALRYIREQPMDWVALMLRKFALVFTSIEIVDTEDQYTHGESSWILFVADKVFHFGVLAPLAVLGLFVTWARRERLLPLYLMFVIYTGTIVVFYVFARYRLPLVPFLLIFAGGAAAEGRSFFQTLARPNAAWVITAVVAIAAFCNWPMADKTYMRSVTHYNLGNELANVGRTDEAIASYRTAVSLHAGNALATHNLGALLAGQGDLAGAKVQYLRALQINPQYAHAHFNLARTLLESGDGDGAIAHFAEGLGIEPQHADVHNELGEIQMAAGDLSAAILSFEAALRQAPGDPAAAANLDRARKGSGF